jgi:hypothetical protein
VWSAVKCKTGGVGGRLWNLCQQFWAQARLLLPLPARVPFRAPGLPPWPRPTGYSGNRRSMSALQSGAPIRDGIGSPLIHGRALMLACSVCFSGRTLHRLGRVPQVDLSPGSRFHPGAPQVHTALTDPEVLEPVVMFKAVF